MGRTVGEVSRVPSWLAISAAAPSEETAITLVPLAIIPQIVLSGQIAPLNGFSRVLALLGVSTYWGKRGLDACLPADVVQAVPGGLEQHSAWVAVLVLGVHAAASAVVALVVLHAQGRRRRGLAALVRDAIARSGAVMQK